MNFSQRLAYSIDSEWLAAGTTGGSVYVWRLSDGELLYSGLEQSSPIQKLVFSQDGTYLVISTFSGAWIWSIGSDQLSSIDNSSNEISGINAVDISSSGNMLVTAYSDGSVIIQKLPNGIIIGRMEGNRRSYLTLQFPKMDRDWQFAHH